MAEKADQFEQYLNTLRRVYSSNHLLVTMGGDFRFINSERAFQGTEALIDYFNANNGLKQNIHLKFSTPSMFVDAVTWETWPTFYGDFLPYSDNANSYWTGLYTSRPLLKSRIRKLSQIVNAASMLFSMGALDQNLAILSPYVLE